MIVSSLSGFSPTPAAPTVLLSSSSQPRPLDSVGNSATFCFDWHPDPASLRVIVLDLPEENPELYLAELTRPDDRAVEWWVPTSNLSTLISALHTWDTLAIAGITACDYWIKVLLAPAARSPARHSAADFARGLSLVRMLGTDPSTAPGIEPSAARLSSDVLVPTLSLRAAFISTVAPKFKPLKKFLPHSVVIALYKILEKLR